MSASSTGRWVRRVGASGGGKSYRRRRPINYYGVLALICVLGVSSVALARYQYRHPTAAAPETPPTVGTTWFSALGIDTCGVLQPALAANPTGAVSGFSAIPDGVIQVKPVLKSQTGTAATLAAFVAAYEGLTVTKQELVLPPSSTSKKSVTYRTGAKCPAGTKDAGKVGQVVIAHWKNQTATVATRTTDAAKVHFSPNQLIAIGFVPVGTLPARPPESAIVAMLSAVTGATTTTTTTPHGTTTTSHGTSTSSSSTTTTTKG